MVEIGKYYPSYEGVAAFMHSEQLGRAVQQAAQNLVPQIGAYCEPGANVTSVDPTWVQFNTPWGRPIRASAQVTVEADSMDAYMNTRRALRKQVDRAPGQTHKPKR